MRIRLTLVCLGLLFTNTASAADVVLVQYAFTSGTLNPTTVLAGLTANAIKTTGSTATVSTAGVTIPSTMNDNQSGGSTSAVLDVSNNSFLQFTVTPDVGVTVDLASLSFEVGNGGASSPRGYDLRSSLDAYATSTASAEITTIVSPVSPVFQNSRSLLPDRII